MPLVYFQLDGSFLRSPIQAQSEKETNSILASVALHNWLTKHEDSQKVYGKFYCPSGYVDYEDAYGIIHKGTWRSEVSESGDLQELQNTGPNNYGKRAEHYRMVMANFFLSLEGELPWQYQCVTRTACEPIQ